MSVCLLVKLLVLFSVFVFCIISIAHPYIHVCFAVLQSAEIIVFAE